MNPTPRKPDKYEIISCVDTIPLLILIAVGVWAQQHCLNWLYNIFPRVMTHTPGPHQQVFRHTGELRQFITGKIHEHKDTLDPDNPRDYIDCFLIKMEQEKDLPNTEFFYDNLVSTVLNLFFADTETTSTTMRYAMMLLIKHPEIQVSPEEFDIFIPVNKLPCTEVMANSKALVSSGSVWSSQHVEQLSPVAEKTALLYNMSYLCLANFARLEGLLRSRALETQLLFGSSEALLSKCVGTSNNLVKTLFPNLKRAVEMRKSTLAVRFLEKAREWINHIITEVEGIVKRYSTHNHDISATTSEVVAEKIETDNKITSQNEEVNQNKIKLDKYNSMLEKTSKELKAAEEKLVGAQTELTSFIREVSTRNAGLGLLSALVPFVGAIITASVRTSLDPEDQAKISTLEKEIFSLTSDISHLKQKEFTLELTLVDIRMLDAKAKFDLGSIPSPEYLDDVQRCLSRIQQILIEIQKFWEYVGSALDTLKEKTFAGEDMIDDKDLQDVFLESISLAEKSWMEFGCGCKKAIVIFHNQSSDAYKFLEVNPSSLSKEEWQMQYDAVKVRLGQIYPAPPAIEKKE